ncbi:cytochrome d ubiquinol oxidase subunit II [Paludibacterium denitrificans]|uniref:cytochrome d ubiquinol oxidase subunit II n=1 Tax=Paludibacterium denitrificans TaxID=2675226 RepID=UPI0028B2614F|nr:cytochrome d ubiquinol oxidase subunit II [Paludibacterium denitrificans]
MLFARLQQLTKAFWSSALSMAGIIATAGISMFPFIMPSSSDPRSSLTVWDAVSSHFTLVVMLVAAVIFTPIVIAYTSWAYKVMWGKVTEDDIRANDHSAY